MKKSKNERAPISNSVRRYNEFCLILNIEPKAGESLDLFRKLKNSINDSVISMIKGENKPISAANAIEQINKLIEKHNAELSENEAELIEVQNYNPITGGGTFFYSDLDMIVKIHRPINAEDAKR